MAGLGFLSRVARLAWVDRGPKVYGSSLTRFSNPDNSRVKVRFIEKIHNSYLLSLMEITQEIKVIVMLGYLVNRGWFVRIDFMSIIKCR